MNVNGHIAESADGQALQWTRRVLAANDLRESLKGRRRLILSPETIVTPSAAEQLRADGIEVVRQAKEERVQGELQWGHAQDRPYPLVGAALWSLKREGIPIRSLFDCKGPECGWARAVAECVARGECRGGAVFCADPGLVCCVANKVKGVRAVPVVHVDQAARATLTLGANVLAVEMPGRTFFEIRQIMRLLFATEPHPCPPGVACTLTELDGHAHR
jgi:Ribose/Galactose Isomerase